MKRFLIILLISAQAATAHAIAFKADVLQNAASGSANGSETIVQGYTSMVVQVAGTISAGSVNFEGTVDGTNFFSVQCVSVADRAVFAASATATGAWRCQLNGFTKFRARIAGVTGSVTVTAMSMAAGVF